MSIFGPTDTRHYKEIAKNLMAIEAKFAKKFRGSHYFTYDIKTTNTSEAVDLLSGYIYAYGVILVNKVLLDNNLKREQFTMISILAKTHRATTDALYRIIDREPERWRRNIVCAAQEQFRNGWLRLTPASARNIGADKWAHYGVLMFLQSLDQVEALVNEWSKDEGLPRIVFQETLF